MNEPSPAAPTAGLTARKAATSLMTTMQRSAAMPAEAGNWPNRWASGGGHAGIARWKTTRGAHDAPEHGLPGGGALGHMLPGYSCAKTTTAEALGKIYAGADRAPPEIREVADDRTSGNSSGRAPAIDVTRALIESHSANSRWTSSLADRTPIMTREHRTSAWRRSINSWFT